MDLRTSFERLAVNIARPLRLARKPCQRVERHLGIALGESDRRAVMDACARDGVGIGRYYHWYLEKLLVARRLNSATRAELIELVEAADASDLRALDDLLDQQASAVLALPHFGHYMLAALSIVTRHAARRDVGLFYGDPATHRGNEVFDQVHASRFNTPADARIHVLHANRAGMGEALRLLRSGGLLVMMPDVHRNADETYFVPFLDRALDVMLGSASLARKTSSALIPILPLPVGALRFELRFAAPVDAATQLTGASAYRDEWLDYIATAMLFEHYERWMAGNTILWQYVRELFLRSTPFVALSPRTLEDIWPTFLADPRNRANDGQGAIELPGRRDDSPAALAFAPLAVSATPTFSVT